MQRQDNKHTPPPEPSASPFRASRVAHSAPAPGGLFEQLEAVMLRMEDDSRGSAHMPDAARADATIEALERARAGLSAILNGGHA